MMKKNNLKNGSKIKKAPENKIVSALEKVLEKKKKESAKIKALNKRLDANNQQLIVSKNETAVPRNFF
ncbi:MAG: hypothetical protein U9Q34_00580 [Elusimicrobiota bacterium]|nr:hypothetical protein [Elusimicrobiota bacterium]